MASINSELSNNLKRLTQNITNSSLYGKKIYLLGSAEYGPVNEPIKIKSTVGLYNKFGKQGTLINAFHEIKYTTQNNDVYLVKTTGEHAITYLNVNVLEEEIISNAFILMSSEANEIFNDIRIHIDTEYLAIEFPLDLNVPEHILTYYYKDYPTIELLSSAINLDTKHKRSYINANYTVDPSTRTDCAFYVCNPNIVNLYGGQCGLNYTKNLLYTSLTKTYDILESSLIDIIIPVDAFIDDLYPDDSEDEQFEYNMKYYQSTKDYLTPDTLGNMRSYMNQLIEFCIKQLNFGLVTTGIIGFNPINSYTTNYLYESDYIVEMFKHCLDYNRHLCLNEAYSFLISVVAGDIGYNKNTIIDNGYLAYGAFNASIQLNIGNTNIKISDNLKIYNEFSEEVLAYLAENGIVTFRHSPLYDTPVVYNGITATSRPKSPLRLYCNVRMIQMCISYLNKLFQYYIGLDLKWLIESDNMNQNIKDILSILVSKNIINDYNFELIPDYNKGNLIVNLDLITNFMTESIKINSIININQEEA